MLPAVTFLEVAARLSQYLIQVSMTCVDTHMRGELREATSYNQ